MITFAGINFNKVIIKMPCICLEYLSINESSKEFLVIDNVLYSAMFLLCLF